MYHWHSPGNLESRRRVSQPLCKAGVCSRLGSEVGCWLAPGEATALVENNGAASEGCNVSGLNCKHEPQIPKKGKDSRLPGLCRSPHRSALRPACGPCQAEARKQECSESKALFLFVLFVSPAKKVKFIGTL